MNCEQCNYSWDAKLTNPKCCPRCRRYLGFVMATDIPIVPLSKPNPFIRKANMIMEQLLETNVNRFNIRTVQLAIRMATGTLSDKTIQKWIRILVEELMWLEQANTPDSFKLTSKYMEKFGIKQETKSIQPEIDEIDKLNASLMSK